MFQLPTVTLTGLQQVILLTTQIIDFPLAVLTNKSSMVMIAQSGAKSIRLQAFSADLLPLDAPSITLTPETPLVASGLVPTLEIQVVGANEKLEETFPQSVTSAASILTADINSQVLATSITAAGSNLLLVPDTTPFRVGDQVVTLSTVSGRVTNGPMDVLGINPGVSLTVAPAVAATVNPPAPIVRVPLVVIGNANTPWMPTFKVFVNGVGIGTYVLFTAFANGRTFMFTGILDIYVAAAGATVSLNSSIAGVIWTVDATRVQTIPVDMRGLPSAGSTVNDIGQLIIAGGAASARLGIGVAQNT